MNHFVSVPRDVRENQIYRDALLAQPDDFFRSYFGRSPNIRERVYLVEKLIQMVGAPRTYINDVYQVRVRSVPPYVQLDINRLDGQPCTNWREFQQIKNELIGPECEAVELFPAESRLVDTANQYHLWVNPDVNYRFPLGYKNRLVLDKPIVYSGRSAERLPVRESQRLCSQGRDAVTSNNLPMDHAY